jgi:hypothetical protein
MFPLLPKGDQTKLIKFFWLKIFSICHRCRWHRRQTLSCEYLREFPKKFETVWMEYSGAGGKLIHEKNQKQKISWHCPFKRFQIQAGELYVRICIINRRQCKSPCVLKAILGRIERQICHALNSFPLRENFCKILLLSYWNLETYRDP